MYRGGEAGFFSGYGIVKRKRVETLEIDGQRLFICQGKCGLTLPIGEMRTTLPGYCRGCKRLLRTADAAKHREKAEQHRQMKKNRPRHSGTIHGQGRLISTAPDPA